MSETCKKFNEIFSGSKKLLSKVKVSLKFPDVETGDETLHIERRLNSQPGPMRSYQHLEVIRLRDDILHRTTELKSGFFNVISKLLNVNVLIVERCQILRKDLIRMLRPFHHLSECHFINLALHDDIAPADISINTSCPNLKKLVFR